MLRKWEPLIAPSSQQSHFTTRAVSRRANSSTPYPQRNRAWRPLTKARNGFQVKEKLNYCQLSDIVCPFLAGQRQFCRKCVRYLTCLNITSFYFNLLFMLTYFQAGPPSNVNITKARFSLCKQQIILSTLSKESIYRCWQQGEVNVDMITVIFSPWQSKFVM